MEKDVAKLDYSPKRLFRKFLLEIQKSWLIPGSMRYKLLKLGGVNVEPCFIGTEVSFDTLRPDLISIRKGCVITSGTRILTHFFHSEDRKMYLGSVIIGENVFIGMNAMIVNSVTIGDNAVIGAGSVIAKDIPAGEVWAGVPAKFIKKL